MSVRRPPPGPADPGPWIEGLRAAIDAARPLLHVTLPAARQAKVFASKTVAAALELASGAVAELEGGRPVNAMRLARHLFEHEIELHYVLDRPVHRLHQMRARGAKQQLDVARGLNSVNRMPRSKRDRFKELEKEANVLNERARRAKAPADEWGVPPRRDMAQAIGRLSDYDTYYIGASHYSHPDLAEADAYLRERDGLVVAASSPTHPYMPGQASWFAFVTLIDLVGRANWSIGPLPGMDSHLRQLDEKTAAKARR